MRTIEPHHYCALCRGRLQVSAGDQAPALCPDCEQELRPAKRWGRTPEGDRAKFIADETES